MGRQALALLRQLEAACISCDELAEAVETSFHQRPDAAIITSFPGLGTLTGHGYSPRWETTPHASPAQPR